MGKRVLLGSMLILTLLLLMPSIPAIQHKIIEDKAYDNLVELLEDDVKHGEQKQRLLSSIKSYLSNLEGFSEYDKSDEFLKSIESDNIQDFLQNEDLNNIYDSEKIQKFVNSETFKHFTSSDFVQTLLNNNYDFESKINPWIILEAIIVFILGLITWIPAIIFSILIAVPMILVYSIAIALYEFSQGFSHLIIGVIESIITGIVYAISNWLMVFIAAILWPFFLLYYFYY